MKSIEPDVTEPEVVEPNPFVEHPARRGTAQDEQWLFAFANGFGASVIRGEYTYGGTAGLWELAVLYGGELTYVTPITDDVLGYLSVDEVRSTLRAIAELAAS